MSRASPARTPCPWVTTAIAWRCVHIERSAGFALSPTLINFGKAHVFLDLCCPRLCNPQTRSLSLKFAKKPEVGTRSGLPGRRRRGKIHWVTTGQGNRRTLEVRPFEMVAGKTGRKKGITRLKPKKRFRGFKFDLVDLRIGVTGGQRLRSPVRRLLSLS